MKAIKIIPIFFLLLWSAVDLKAQQGTRLTVPLSRMRQPYELNIEANGPVTVCSYDGKEIIIVKNGGEDPFIDENNNVVTIRSAPSRAGSAMILRIPSKLIRLKLRSMATGNTEIIINNVRGELEIANSNGGIQLNNISGSVVASTTNGNIIGFFRSTNPRAAMAFSAFKGGVDVSFPQNIKASVDLRTDRGKILSDFDLQSPKGFAPIAKGNDLSRHRIDRSIKASINGGGSEIFIKTITGDINIRKLK